MDDYRRGLRYIEKNIKSCIECKEKVNVLPYCGGQLSNDFICAIIIPLFSRHLFVKRADCFWRRVRHVTRQPRGHSTWSGLGHWRGPPADADQAAGVTYSVQSVGLRIARHREISQWYYDSETGQDRQDTWIVNLSTGSSKKIALFYVNEVEISIPFIECLWFHPFEIWFFSRERISTGLSPTTQFTSTRLLTLNRFYFF